MNGSCFTAFYLVPNGIYRVVAPFADFDGNIHAVGECWRCSFHNYLPYDAGLTLNVEREGVNGAIRLQVYPEAQREIIDRFSEYVTQVEAAKDIRT
jgi:hypothetical protein